MTEPDVPFKGPGGPLGAGVDEAGAGPLCGGLYAAAVVLDPDNPIAGLNDSKKLSASAREALAVRIRRQALGFAVVSVAVEEIDRINILQARMRALAAAVNALQPSPDCAFVDGNRVPAGLPCRAEAVVQGDTKVPAIMAASILAKVARDQEMLVLDRVFPGYGLARHKGYGTRAHLTALAQLGPTPIHRRSFAPVRRALAAQNPAQGEER
ncbi:MAG: ribonuclease HII [Pseudomonadota bacterium]|nr:ribonuclease HII [Pseudomonadota bacterium]